MRKGISRVVTEIIILVAAVTLALLIFSPLSEYIFGSISGLPKAPSEEFKIISVGMKQGSITVYLQNMKGDVTVTKDDFIVIVDGTKCTILSADQGLWKKGDVISVTAQTDADIHASHHIEVFVKEFSTVQHYIYYGG